MRREYQAAKLQSDNATVDVSGAGNIVVNARKKLKASISGAGVVEYLGDPVVKESISGVGTREAARIGRVPSAHRAARLTITQAATRLKSCRRDRGAINARPRAGHHRP